ncbi:FMN reductase [Actinomadura rubrobrunea]|uniref:FMN reductase n=1 Tax=Actinomadura rubrobrunea TaxID=115335 RepID=A0A9W6UUJ9_9ACTN|nr:NAD(P)H-dependent oxidoreductase [Actinomadura rubrobrunea]GLW64711.1 FMN reductase [Actinomadura rubrobrunea]
MSDTPLRVAIIIGSTRAGRFGTRVAKWFAEQARKRPDMAVEVVDPALRPLPVVLDAPASGPAEADALEQTRRTLDAADAFVIVTPEYNHSFPAALKNLIDLHSTEWQAKPVAFVSYGGLSGGLRAVEHLRQVFAELHAVTIRDTVSFHNPWEEFDAGGHHTNPTACNAAAKVLLDRLAWWAHALRDAKAKRPYAA